MISRLMLGATTSLFWKGAIEVRAATSIVAALIPIKEPINANLLLPFSQSSP